MPSILASTIIGRARTILQDSGSTAWTDNTLLGWLNEGQRAICAVRPDASSSNLSHQLTTSVSKQSLPTTATRLLRPVRNLGANGTTPGEAIRPVSMDLMDAHLPSWHTATSSTTVKHVIQDPTNPRVFFVYPPPNGALYIELLCAVPPTDVAAVGNAISIDDHYSGPLIDYICMRGFMEDNELAGNAERASAHAAAFAAAIQTKAT